MKSLFYFSPHISVSKADMLHAMPHIEEILANVDELEQTIHEAQNMLSPYCVYAVYKDVNLFIDFYSVDYFIADKNSFHILPANI